MFITSPEKFAEWFNKKYKGTHRQILTDDVKDMTVCGLVHRFGYYGESTDGETIRGILQYEQLRENRSLQQEKENKPPTCKICGQPLLANPQGTIGRPKEYCSGCERHRNRERQKKLRYRRNE
jgi:hypothetical protein